MTSFSLLSLLLLQTTKELDSLVLSEVHRAVFNDNRNTNTKVITANNHNRSKQRNEPIRIPSNYLRRGKNRAYTVRLVLVLVVFSLVDKQARNVLANH